MGEQLPNIVKYLSDIAEKKNIKVKPLWLPKLSSIIYVEELRKKYSFARKPFNIQIIIGEYDNPANQKQGILTVDLTDKGNVVIYSMNEKNTIVNTMLYSMITTYTVNELNIYVLDFDSETLKVYEDAPQVGDVVFASESEKVDKLLKMLSEEIEKRKKLFQDYNGSYEFYTIVTAISDRAMRLNMRSNFQTIIPLKLSAPIEYNMLLGKKVPTISDIANRGVVLIDDEPYEFQTATVGCYE